MDAASADGAAAAAARWSTHEADAMNATDQRMRVLIVRLSAVGDCIQTLPLACALRDHWPAAHITWAVEKGAAPLVAVCDAVDRIVTLPKAFATSVSQLARLRKELRGEAFDVALDPQGLTKSGLVAWLSGARRRIGFSRPVGRELNPWLQTELVASRAVHRVERYLELLTPLRIERPQVRFGLRIPAADEKLSLFFSHQELRGGFVAINPGAGWDSNRWPIERYAEVARNLGQHAVRSVVTWGGPQERQWAEAIVAQSGGAALLAPPTSLLELAALLKRARLFVGSDTGPLHLAAAVGTPCVALFGASSAAGCGPFGPGHVCLQEALDESAGRKRPGADNWAMRRIAVDAAVEACLRLLTADRHASSRAA
jgi:heptosyltransferase I